MTSSQFWAYDTKGILVEGRLRELTHRLHDHRTRLRTCTGDRTFSEGDHVVRKAATKSDFVLVQ